MTLICSRCAGVHRGFESHISRVRSLKLDKIADSELEQLLVASNADVNLFLEHAVPIEYPKPNENSSEEDRTSYIKAKYIDQIFKHQGVKETRKRHPPVFSSKEDFIEQKDSTAHVEFSGILHCFLENGVNLLSADVNGFSDPYVILSTAHQSIKSSIKKKTLNPVWNEMILLNVKDFNSESLKLDVFDWDRFSKDDHLGYCEIKLKSVPGLKEGKNVLFPCPLDTMGAITLKLQYTDYSK